MRRIRSVRTNLPLLALLPLALLSVPPASAEPVAVRYPQGTVHGFVVVKTLEGKRIATGDSIQTVHGDRVTSQLTLHFRDGSLDEETTVFTQEKVLRLISDHHVQRGPSFPKPIDVMIDAVTGQITSHDKDGKERQDHMDLDPDVANGLPSYLLMNLDPAAPEVKVAYVAPTEKPRLIHLSIKSGGEVPISIGGVRRKAVDYILHAELGGVAGVIAPIIGKAPPDQHVWMLAGPAPVFIRQQGQFYEGGPTWRMEQVSATFAQ
jgi:hypothetical protein